MKRQFHLLAIILLMTTVPLTGVFSNNLTVSNVSVDQANKLVAFDLKWDNSWRNTFVAPHNWDAAWVFVKWKSCDSDGSVSFVHGIINTTLSAHVFNGSSGGTTTFEPTTRTGSVGIDVTDINNNAINTGIMLRNSTDGIANTVSVGARVTLNVTNIPASGSFDFRVYGIEMVFCNQGSYYLGDANGNNTITVSGANDQSQGCFAAGTSAPNSNRPLYISSEDQQTITESINTGIVCPSGTCTSVAAAFPKGFGAFYIMKYEISQGQYADFLSAIPSVAQQLHYPNNSTALNYYSQSGTNYSSFTWSSATNGFTFRYSINGGGVIPNQYVATRPDRACNWISWSDLSAYLDWAALRPLSEMEYEKACRGPLTPVPFERAWGTSTLTIPAAGAITPNSAETGAETISTTGAQANVPTSAAAFNSWTSGDAGSAPYSNGPLRCGIFVKTGNTSRVLSGTGYYGAADLTGNVAEYYITPYCGISGQTCNSGLNLGDGNLDVFGNANVSNWPDRKNPWGISGTNTPGSYVISRGGSWFTDDRLNSTTYGTPIAPNDPNPNGNSMLNVSSRSNRNWNTNNSNFTSIYHYVLNGAANHGRLRDPMTGGRGGR